MKATSWMARKIMGRDINCVYDKCLLLWPISICVGRLNELGGERKGRGRAEVSWSYGMNG